MQEEPERKIHLPWPTRQPYPQAKSRLENRRSRHRRPRSLDNTSQTAVALPLATGSFNRRNAVQGGGDCRRRKRCAFALNQPRHQSRRSRHGVAIREVHAVGAHKNARTRRNIIQDGAQPGTRIRQSDRPEVAGGRRESRGIEAAFRDVVPRRECFAVPAAGRYCCLQSSLHCAGRKPRHRTLRSAAHQRAGSRTWRTASP